MNTKVKKNRLSGTIAIFLLMILFFSCKTQNVYTGIWLESPDLLSKSTIQSMENMQYNKGTKMFYSLYNDNERIYVLMSVNDRTIQKKILIAGLTLWIDTVAKKKKQFGITFPRAGSMKNSFSKMNKEQMMQQVQNSGMQQSINYAELNQKFSNNLQDMEIVGFNHKKKTEIVFNQSNNGIKASIQFDEEGTLHYQASIPLNFVFNNPDEYLKSTYKMFSFGFETGAIDMPSMATGRMPMGGMSGGMPGGGKHGGMQGMQGMQEMSKPSKFWVNSAHLSYKF